MPDPAATSLPARVPVVGVGVSPATWDDLRGLLDQPLADGPRGWVVAANVHVVVMGTRDAAYRAALDGARLVLPDGMPLVWVLRRSGRPAQERRYGPQAMLELCEEATRRGESVFLYGGRPEVLPELQRRLEATVPGLVVSGAVSPPFRPLTPDEDAADVERIRATGAGVVFVGLGAPKQELWMAAHGDRVDALMVGVGAAFDFHAGTVRQAPPRLQRLGLEWAFRLAVEPRRLWRRYLATNTRFLWLLLRGALAGHR